MMKGHGSVQPGWDSSNHGRHTARTDDPFDGCRGLRATADSPADWGKGTGAALALSGVAWPKVAAVVDLQGQPPRDGGVGLHGDGDVGQ
jgi:hypothetical protein